jgi:hypothetical protein
LEKKTNPLIPSGRSLHGRVGRFGCTRSRIAAELVSNLSDPFVTFVAVVARVADLLT